MRSFVLPLAATLVAAIAACSGADQTSLTGDRHSYDAPTDPSDSTGVASEDPGTTPSDGDENATDDGGAATADEDASSAPAPTAADAGKNDCLDAVASPGGGKHHAGDDCGSCHDSLGSSRRWTVSGTLYATANGGGAVSGATIEVIDANGKTVRLKTYDNGNFYTTTSVQKPLKVRATKCPADLAMVAGVSDGSCNGCHGSGSRIHL